MGYIPGLILLVPNLFSGIKPSYDEACYISSQKQDLCLVDEAMKGLLGRLLGDCKSWRLQAPPRTRSLSFCGVFLFFFVGWGARRWPLGPYQGSGALERPGRATNDFDGLFFCFL